jgi:hypothetical protein
MERSEQPTPYIFIRAYIQSEWDNCDFAIIKLTDEWLENMRRRIALLEPFKEDSTFYSHQYWDKPEGFFTNMLEDGEDIAEIILKGESQWIFVTLEENELDLFPVPENAIGNYQLVLSTYGSARFTANGKHTGEEFYTADFNIEEFINSRISNVLNTIN